MRFDRALLGLEYSIYYGPGGAAAFPMLDAIRYADDNRTVVMSVRLERGRDYQFVMTGKHFVSTTGEAMKSYPVTFSTRQ